MQFQYIAANGPKDQTQRPCASRRQPRGRKVDTESLTCETRGAGSGRICAACRIRRCSSYRCCPAGSNIDILALVNALIGAAPLNSQIPCRILCRFHDIGLDQDLVGGFIDLLNNGHHLV